MTFISDIARSQVADRMADLQIDSVWIRRPGAATLDATTGLLTEPVGTDILRGNPPGTPNARVKLVTPSGQIALGEGQVPQRQLQVSLPIDAAVPRVNDQLTVEAAQDAALVGSTWRIIGLDAGGAWAVVRHLSCTAWDKSNYWTGTQ